MDPVAIEIPQTSHNNRPRLQSFSQQNKIKKNSFFIGAHEESVIMKHEEIDVHKSVLFNNINNINLNQEQQKTEKQTPISLEQQEKIINKQKKDMIQQRVNQRKSTNLQVIMSITNTLIGSVVLCLPYNWLHGGFLSSLIIMIIMGAISYYTCTIYVQNQLPTDTEGYQVVNRILGAKASKIFKIMSSALFYMAAIVYFMLQNQVLYAFIKFIFFYADENKELPEINTINFSQFSVQYQCIVLAIPVFFVISMKDLSIIIKLGQYGVLAVTAYGLYITYLFIYNLSIPDFSVNWGEVKLFPTDISSIVLVMGNFGLAFFIHSGINTILANSKDQSKNIRNVSFGYLNVLIIYGLIGVFGSIGIINLDWQQDGIQTVSQLFDRQDILPAIINVLFLFQLSTSLPILTFISRNTIFSLIFKDNLNYPHKYNVIFNFIFILCAVLCQLLAINPSVIMGIDGAICGTCLLYIIPLLLRLKTYGKQPLSQRIQQKQHSVKIQDLVLTLQNNRESQNTNNTNNPSKQATETKLSPKNQAQAIPSIEQIEQIQENGNDNNQNQEKKQQQTDLPAQPVENKQQQNNNNNLTTVQFETQVSLTKNQQQKQLQQQSSLTQEEIDNYYKGFQRLPWYEYVLWSGMMTVGVIAVILQFYGIFA